MMVSVGNENWEKEITAGNGMMVSMGNENWMMVSVGNDNWMMVSVGLAHIFFNCEKLDLLFGLPILLE